MVDRCCIYCMCKMWEVFVRARLSVRQTGPDSAQLSVSVRTRGHSTYNFTHLKKTHFLISSLKTQFSMALSSNSKDFCKDILVSTSWSPSSFCPSHEVVFATTQHWFPLISRAYVWIVLSIPIRWLSGWGLVSMGSATFSPSFLFFPKSCKVAVKKKFHSSLHVSILEILYFSSTTLFYNSYITFTMRTSLLMSYLPINFSISFNFFLFKFFPSSLFPFLFSFYFLFHFHFTLYLFLFVLLMVWNHESLFLLFFISLSLFSSTDLLQSLLIFSLSLPPNFFLTFLFSKVVSVFPSDPTINLDNAH